MRISVRVQPGATRAIVGGRWGDAEPPVLVVRVTARAVEGAANSAVVDAIADAFGCRPRDVRLISGDRARVKILEIDGDEATNLSRFWELLVP